MNNGHYRSKAFWCQSPWNIVCGFWTTSKIMKGMRILVLFRLHSIRMLKIIGIGKLISWNAKVFDLILTWSDPLKTIRISTKSMRFYLKNDSIQICPTETETWWPLISLQFELALQNYVELKFLVIKTIIIGISS